MWATLSVAFLVRFCRSEPDPARPHDHQNSTPACSIHCAESCETHVENVEVCTMVLGWFQIDNGHDITNIEN